MELLGFFVFEPRYFFFIAPGVLLALWAQWKVKSAYAKAGRIRAQYGLTGAETAQRILNFHGINNVAVEPARSFLGDHYDPKRKVLRLSPDVYNGRSLASLGIAAHEVGHAIQDATSYGPLAIRSGLVPMAAIGPDIAGLLVLVGLGIGLTGLTTVGLVLCYS